MHFDTPAWQAIDKLVAEQKLEAARVKLAALRKAAEKAGNASDWTRALIRDAQLQVALGRAETAVRSLREASWPKDALSRLILQLYYAGTLIHYLDAHAYEIAQRERVSSDGVVDLKAWTRDQIFEEALGALQHVWARREALSGPADIFGPYVERNNYPEGIRDTLRDVLSYHIAQLLANTQNWRAAEQNELFRLDHGALLRGPWPLRSGVDDASVHPLVRAIAVLSDLAAWHSEQGRKQAALEAELARLRLVHAEFTEAPEQKAQTAALKELLQQTRALSWWSMGQLQLAQWSRDRGALPLAREQAQAGAQAHPDSHGAKACARLVAEIEAPEFSLGGMLVDGPKRRSLSVRHKNLKQLYFRAYRADLTQRIREARDYNLLRNGPELRELLKGEPAAQWQVGLPDPGDFAEHRSYVTPPLATLGYYVVFASPRPDFAAQANRVEALHLFISQLVLRHRRDKKGALEVQVLDGDSGAPVQGAELTLYQFDWHSGHKRVASQTSDAAGRARLSAPVSAGYRSFALLAKRGADVSPSFDNVSLGVEQHAGEEQRSAFIFTDRSIYRPQQKVQWKLLAYRGHDANWYNLKGKSIDVALHDANGQEVQKVSVKTNAYGTASGSFSIPAGHMLGQWSIRHSLGGTASIQVEQYKRPTFEMKLLPSQDAARLNQPVKVRGEATYYFGQPVQHAPIRWKVLRQQRYPWWWGFWHPPARAPQVVAAGQGSVDAQGSFAFEFTPAADPQADPAVQYHYHVIAELTDEGGETRSARRDFTLGQVSLDAHIDLEGGFVVEGASAQLSLRRENLNGDPRPGLGRYRIVRLQQPEQTPLPAQLPIARASDRHLHGAHTPGDEQRSRQAPDYQVDEVLASWPDGSTVSAAEIRTDNDGKATIDLPKLEPGAYRVHYESEDAYGGKLAVKTEFLVAGAQTHLALPAVLKLEHSSVQSGDTARVLATTGFNNQPLWLEVYAGDTLIERRALESGAPAIHEIKIGPEQRGGISLALVGLRDYQPLEQRTALFVPWDDRELSLEFSSFRDLLRPGQKETFRVTVRGKRDHAVVAAAELLAYMYDRSLDAFVPHRPPVPLNLYPRRLGNLSAAWSVHDTRAQAVFRERWFELPEVPALHGDALVFPDSYAFGGPGARGYGGGIGVRRMALAESAAASPVAGRVPAPAPQAKGDVVAFEQMQDARPQTQPPMGEVRSNFAETAFFLPHLLTGKDGSAAIEFKVPDSVTSWNVWVHAITRDFRSGSVHKPARSAKDLLVRPYLPRFVREADQAALKVVVNNAGKQALSGVLRFELFDPQTERSLNTEFGVKQGPMAFQVAAGDATDLTIDITAPRRVGDVALRVIGKAGEVSDGELRPLPLLPSRLHLVQSKFAALRGAGSRRVLQLPDLASTTDPTRTNEQLVVTVQAQLFMSVLKALPFLIDYPYECSEQTLNRFLSAGIVASVFNKYPAVQQLARDLVKRRDSLLDKFDDDDPNRKLLLEESPWLSQAQGGPDLDESLIKVLDPPIAAQERDRALGRLAQMQTAAGGFPWFVGGPPSPYMTLYLMIGMARATEFDIDVPRPMLQRAWQYLARHYREQILAHVQAADAPVEFVTLLQFATSAYGDKSLLGGAFTQAETQQMLNYAFARWTKLPPLLKCVLTTALLRAGRKADAALVFDSVMDSAKTTDDEGTFWQPEDRAWLWYNDRIETHAFALRTLLELDDSDPRLEGMVVWLLLNKQLNQWKSTRATAEVIYSLTKYLERKSAVADREIVTVKVGDRPPAALHFEPSQYAGKTQIAIAGADVRPQDARIEADKTGHGMAFVSASWHYATDRLPREARGDLFRVERKYFKREAMGEETQLVPLGDDAVLRPGDEVEVQLAIESRAQAQYVQLRDPRPAGLEPPVTVSQYHYDLGLVYYEEVRDSAQNFFIEQLPAGQYTLKYRLRANMAGEFRVGPATLQSMYAPEFAGFSAGHSVRIAN